MRRFVTLCVLLLFAIPFGVSISGCSKTTPPVFCNGGDSGPVEGQVASITLGPIVSGVSMNFAEIAGLPQQPNPTDCKGQSAFAGPFTYGSTDMTIADVVPTGAGAGRLCAGSWNRNSGGGIPDYTVCNPTNKGGVVYISASAQGVTSNPLPIFVHPIVTGVVFGANALGPNTGPVPTAAITGYSITNNTPTFTGGNSFAVGQTVSLYGFPTSTFFNGRTNAVVAPYVENITAWSISSNTPTFTAANSFYAGETVTLQNFPASAFFNGQSGVVQPGPTATQFTLSIPGFVHGNGSANETGTGSGLSQNQFVLSIPGFVHGNTSNVGESGYAGPVDCPTDPTTNCYPLTTVGSASALPYVPTACVSSGQTRQLVARVFAGTPGSPVNISSEVGPLLYQVVSAAPSGAGSSGPVVTIDPNGVATAGLPGSTQITAYVGTAASSAGFFSTCPPASITLAALGTTGSGPYVINQNNTLPLTATVLDTAGQPITGLSLEYESTAPTTLPTSLASVTPFLAGAASITAICQPPACNPSAYNQIGLFGNGKPVVSNSINVVAPGSNSTVLVMASTQSQYMTFRDFTQNSLPASLLLPFTPNSMVINVNGSTIYMGSTTALMVVTAGSSLSLARVDLNSEGTVIAISPDSSQIVISDPIKKIISIENSSGGVVASYGGVATRAQYTPDSQTVYIAAGNQVLVYSAFTGWTSESPTALGGTQANDVAVTVPAIGAYFAGPKTTDVSYCEISTPGTPGNESNIFYPSADSSVQVGNPIQTPVTTDRIAATNDGQHILGATVASGAMLNDLLVQIPSNNLPGPGTPGGPGPGVSVACPLNGTLTFSNTVASTPLTQITASAINGVFPTSDSSEAFITYTGTGGVLPAYAPSATGAGTIKYIPLSGAATAPLSGVLSADNTTFYTGTSGDNLVHIINRSTLKDTGTLAPNLLQANPVNPNGPPVFVPVDLLVQKPRTAN